jgi:hypothetical protein
MNGRPRVIRKVTKMGRDGRPKVVRDRRLQQTAERIICQSEKQCCNLDCPQPDKMIVANWTYVKITYPRIGFSRYPISKAFHMNCAPDEARPMLRFLVGSWPGPWSSITS